VSRFLLDANLSPRSAAFLRDTLGLDAIHIRDVRSGTIPDDEVVAVAKESGRVIITYDTDFGEIHHFREHGLLGVIQLELRDQTIESAHRVLKRFFQEQAVGIDFEASLVVLEIDRVRVIRPE
jgi:predicted nuclease of predicted toxin-antitoxin system